MAEKPAAEKTEQPTPRKIRKAREEGQVPQSIEVTAVSSLIVLVAGLALTAPSLLQWIMNLVKQGFSANNQVFASSETFLAYFGERFIGAIWVTSPILGGLVLAAIAANVGVAGPNISSKAVGFKLSSINPISGFGKLFNTKSLVKLMVTIVKLIFISVIVWSYLHDKLDALLALRWAWSMQIIVAMSKLILGLLIRVCMGLIIVAIADLIYQKYKYIEDLKMTRQEVKEEHKSSEGSPQVKSKIRQIQYQIALKRITSEVPKASVVLVNPTHYAVALQYDSKTMESPILVAKGVDHMAEKIREIATANGIPVIRRPQLTRSIYASIEPGETIPQELYMAVAEVLALIYRLKQQRTASL